MTAYVVTILALGALGLALHRLGGAFRQFRGTRVVTCPQSGQPAAVELAAGRAAWEAVLRKPKLRLGECSRWGERRDCAQQCLGAIEAAPAECLLRTILRKWYQGKSCACCGRAVGRSRWSRRQPALMGSDLRIFVWSDFRPETIPHALETHRPVCGDCLVAETQTW